MEVKSTLSELPDLLTPQQVADYLNRSLRRTYDLLHLNPKYGGIPCFSTSGRKSRLQIEKKDFIAWIDARKKEQISKFAL
jgi:hypothetical protein